MFEVTNLKHESLGERLVAHDYDKDGKVDAIFYENAVTDKYFTACWWKGPAALRHLLVPESLSGPIAAETTGSLTSNGHGTYSVELGSDGFINGMFDRFNPIMAILGKIAKRRAPADDGDIVTDEPELDRAVLAMNTYLNENRQKLPAYGLVWINPPGNAKPQRVIPQQPLAVAPAKNNGPIAFGFGSGSFFKYPGSLRS